MKKHATISGVVISTLLCRSHFLAYRTMPGLADPSDSPA
jgi:hypothetical protein